MSTFTLINAFYDKLFFKSGFIVKEKNEYPGL